ncbi:hypothetical protein ANCCAN_14040 [Ancylostoma caninum]|uniref:Neurotransmitter-gated ion-channel ligand-binding domain-containing protein n=1 Tax=Ancylostoma caninum TaxID=29170 RepID=A0A368G6J0_ANCCA|nr:hypothetical protein ANCCAN_14040 [Ancylostoma caninum]
MVVGLGHHHLDIKTMLFIIGPAAKIMHFQTTPRPLYVALVQSTPTQIQLVHDLLDKYDKKAKPMWDNSKPINVSFSMDLYQILELNEPQQYILLNAWIIEVSRYVARRGGGPLFGHLFIAIANVSSLHSLLLEPYSMSRGVQT